MISCSIKFGLAALIRDSDGQEVAARVADEDEIRMAVGSYIC